MRHPYIFGLVAAAAVLATAASCEKDSVKQTKVDSSVVPSIVLGDNNIEYIDGTESYYTYPLSANVVAYTEQYEISSDDGNSLSCQKDDDLNYEVPDHLKFRCGLHSKPIYTYDAVYLLVQPAFTLVQTNYGSYGLVETMVNFRVKGDKGTLYLDPNQTNEDASDHLSKCSEACSYILATVEGFGTVSEQKRGYVQTQRSAHTSDLQGSYDLGYTADILPVYVKCKGVKLTLNIVGKKRDNEITRFKSYISIGDNIEVRLPATAYDKSRPTELSDIYTCYVLKK